MGIPVQLADADGYAAWLACLQDPAHEAGCVPLTEDQYRHALVGFATGHRCQTCGARVRVDWWGAAYRCGGRSIVQSQLPPGALYWAPCRRDRTSGRCAEWDDCTGRHLHVVLPNGMHWDMDGRASNCTQPDDRAHRCWVRHGDPPNVHVDKHGRTCSAGAGSIQMGTYHGFLHQGRLEASG